MSAALVFVGSHLDFGFFSRFKGSLAFKGFKLIMLTCKPSLWAIAESHGITCVLVQNSQNSSDGNEIKLTSEILNRQMTFRGGAAFYNGIQQCAERIKQREDISLILIWNGNSIPTKSLDLFAKKNKIPTLFFEISNIPGKIFVDPQGVNAQSLLFDHPEILDRFNISDLLYNEWKAQYVSFKRNELTTQLASKSKQISNPFFPIDSVLTKLLNLPAMGEMRLFDKIKSLVHDRRVNYIYDQYNIETGDYIFFPMQLKGDSQLLLNSDIPQEEAIETAYEISKTQKKDILIKPHPIEGKEEIDYFLSGVKGKEGVYIVNMPTFKIIERSKEIVTLNSTVGLEGLIAGKKVTFLSKSYYRYFQGDRLKQYLLGYLLPVEYFSKNEIPVIILEEMLSRLVRQ